MENSLIGQMRHIVMVFRYRSGHLQRNVLTDAAAATAWQMAMMMAVMRGAGRRRRVLVVGGYVVLGEDVRLELHCHRLLVRIVEILGLHFCGGGWKVGGQNR